MIAKPELRRVVRQMGGAERVQDGLRAFSSNVRALDAIRPQLTEQYPNKWVAMHNQEIAVTADSLERLLEEMDRRGIPRRDAVVEFLDTEERTMIL